MLMAENENIIVAMDEEGGIGKNGSIPWNLSNDLALFRFLTYGKTLAVGRKTYENMGPLENRRIYVLSESGNFDASPKDVHWVQNRENMHFKAQGPIWVAGGESIYKQFIGESENVYLSQIPGTYDCDTFFPKEKLNDYRLVSTVSMKGFDLCRYELIQN